MSAPSLMFHRVFEPGEIQLMVERGAEHGVDPYWIYRVALCEVAKMDERTLRGRLQFVMRPDLETMRKMKPKEAKYFNAFYSGFQAAMLARSKDPTPTFGLQEEGAK